MTFRINVTVIMNQNSEIYINIFTVRSSCRAFVHKQRVFSLQGNRSEKML